MDDPFRPLDDAERAPAAGEPRKGGCPPRPIVPVPDGAPPVGSYRHRPLGKPSALWPYFTEDGGLVGYILRFDTTDAVGQPDKAIRPLTFCDLDGDRRGWRTIGFPEPRPLYNLPALAERPDARVIVTEGEKAASTAGEMFADHVATTPPHGAKAPHKADWSPLAGRGVVVWPDHDDAGRDFAEAAARLAHAAGAASVEIVRVPDAFPPKWDLADPLPAGVTAGGLRRMLDGAPVWEPPADKGEAGTPKGDALAIPDGFDLRPGGLFRRVEDAGGNTEWVWLASSIEVAARVRDADGAAWGMLVVVTDPDGVTHEWTMPAAMMAGDGADYRRVLHDLGLLMAPGVKARNALHEYLARCRPDARARGVTRIGWHPAADGYAFVLPDAVFGAAEGERVLLQSEGKPAHAFREAGTLAEWQEAIGRHCVGNSRLVMAASVALAGPLLDVAGVEGGGVHLVGGSRSGKTTAQRIAGSVWGGGAINGFLRRWRATVNGLEGVAAAHCDAFLVLDELAEIDPKDAGAAAYMLANGQGKSRAGRDGSARASAEWHVLFLSSGEIGLADHMAEAGKRARAGQEVRLADLPADAGAGFGLFKNLHGFTDDKGRPSADAFAEHLRAASLRLYGTPARAFLKKLIPLDRTGLRRRLDAAWVDFRRAHVPDGASGQVLTVGRRFALIGAAGEMAAALGVLPWPAGEATKGAAACFAAWLARRGTAGPAEIEAGIRQVRRFVEAHGLSRFQPWLASSGPNDVEFPTRERVGFRRPDGSGRTEFLCFGEAFRSEIAPGFDAQTLCAVLVERGMMRRSGKTYTRRERLPGLGPTRVYVLTAAVLGDEGSAAGEADDAGEEAA